jgi:hypothetical protein
MSVSAQPTPPSFPAGWYSVEDRPNTMGYWDGHAWTGDYAPSANVPVTSDREAAGGLVVVGYITAVLMPLIGFILGIVVATRPAKVTSKHGAWIIVVSIIAFILWLAIIAHSAQSAATTTY